MKKILFAMLLFVVAAAMQAAIVNNSTVVATSTDSTEVDPVETAYKELIQSIDKIYNSSSFSQKKETKEILYAAAGEIKELIIQSYKVIEEVYVPDPKVEAKKAEYEEYLEMYEEVREDAEWLDAANAYFVKLVEDCINNPKPTELQIKRAKEAAEHLPSEYKLLKNRLKKKVG